jgi:hypothetical protein
MKKKIFISFAALAVAAVAAWNVYLASAQSNNEMSELMLANVEALATGEENGNAACITIYNHYEDPIPCGFGQTINGLIADHYFCGRSGLGGCLQGFSYIQYDCDFRIVDTYYDVQVYSCE